MNNFPGETGKCQGQFLRMNRPFIKDNWTQSVSLNMTQIIFSV